MSDAASFLTRQQQESIEQIHRQQQLIQQQLLLAAGGQLTPVSWNVLKNVNTCMLLLNRFFFYIYYL